MQSANFAVNPACSDPPHQHFDVKRWTYVTHAPFFGPLDIFPMMIQFYDFRSETF
jgi:hypothetical protein